MYLPPPADVKEGSDYVAIASARLAVEALVEGIRFLHRQYSFLYECPERWIVHL
jgi:hypothetical protein